MDLLLEELGKWMYLSRIDSSWVSEDHLTCIAALEILYQKLQVEKVTRDEFLVLANAFHDSLMEGFDYMETFPRYLEVMYKLGLPTLINEVRKGCDSKLAVHCEAHRKLIKKGIRELQIENPDVIRDLLTE